MTIMLNRRLALIAGVSLAGAAACKKGPPGPPVANTKAGPVRGAVVEGVNVFKGVRYGATTEGRRFLPPQPPAPWTEPMDTLEYGNSSPQAQGGNGGGLYNSWQNPRPESEDCLFLNVWSKGLKDEKKRPVMVWFHGGGYATGSGSSKVYDGVRLCNRGDVVLVTVNHRLNAFGYTYLGKACEGSSTYACSSAEQWADSGNVGNLDMIQSLEWVRDNIAEFGGDPANVMIFGESGGGGKVSTLMAMPAAQGLFHRAVVQSGSTLQVRETEAAAASAAKFMEAAGAKTVEELQALTPDALVEKLTTPGVATSPTMDGRSLPVQPFTPGAPEVSKTVPMLIGTTKDEQAILSGARDATLFDLTWETLPGRLASLTPRGVAAGTAIAKTRELYTDANPSEVYFIITTETGMRRNAIIQAERKAAQGGAPAYMYLLAYESVVDGGKWLSPHAFDLVFCFDNVANSATFVGTDLEGAQKVADAMSDAWIKFARDGNPGWDAYTPDHRATMVFNTASAVVVDPRSEEREMYANLKPPAASA